MISESSREDFHKQSFDQLFNIVILGNGINKHQFDLHLEDNPNGMGRRIGFLNFENTQLGKILDNVDQMIGVSITRSDTRNALSSSASKHNRSMILLRKKEVDCAIEELIEFKCLTNSFCDTTSKIYVREIFANYHHMLIANHMHDHTVDWGNFHRFSQHGSKSLNSLSKSFFFRRTNKGERKITLMDQGQYLS